MNQTILCNMNNVRTKGEDWDPVKAVVFFLVWGRGGGGGGGRGEGVLLTLPGWWFVCCLFLCCFVVSGCGLF